MLASLDEVPEPIDIVDVFRRPEHTPDVARAAVAAGARALWLQLGIASDEARAIATDAGLTYVEDRCLKVDHSRLLGRQGREAAG
jgi:predicted CoA-binding protein